MALVSAAAPQGRGIPYKESMPVGAIQNEPAIRAAAARAAKAGNVWLPTGPARWSGLEVDRPLLILFYHVEKTGGSAAMKYLHKMVNNDGEVHARLTSLMDFTQTTCFFALYEDLFPGYRGAWDPRRCTAPTRPSWLTSAVAVEFHAYTRRRYWSELVPKLAELRAHYAAHNGTVISLATFREPVSHVMSVYRMWPPSRKSRASASAALSKHAVPLPEWLPRAVGLQAGSLTLDSWPHMRKGFHNLRGCDTLPQGRERLQHFDIVGVMDCMDSVLSALCARAGWPCAADRPRLELALKQSLRQKPHGVTSGGVVMREASKWASLDVLNATVKALVANAAACDRDMYDDAIRRLGLVPPAKAGEALDRSLCERAVYLQQPKPLTPR